MNWFAIGGAVAVLFYGFVFAIAFRKPMAAGLKQVMNLRRGTLGALAILAIVASVNAQKPGDGGGTNEMNNAGMDLGGDGTNMMMMAGRSITGGVGVPAYAEKEVINSAIVRARTPSLPVMNPNAPRLLSAPPSSIPAFTVTAEDIARGYKLVSETNDMNNVYMMPTNATLLGSVHYVGGHSDFGDHVIDLGDWAFPMGTNGLGYSRLWWRLGGALRYAPHETQSEICAAPADQEYYTVPGESQVWVAETENNTRTVEWDHLIATFDDGTNEVTTTTNNCKIILKENGDFETWFNGYKSLYAYVPPNDWDGDGVPNDDDYYPWDGTLGLAMWSGSISGNTVVILGGDMRAVTASLTPTSTNAVYGTLRMDATSKVNLWTDTNKTVAVTLPLTLTPNGSTSFYVEGVDQSEGLGDVHFYLDVSVGEEEWTFTHQMTVASIKELRMTSLKAGTSKNPPPFEGETFYPFSESVNPNPDKHLMIPYWDVLDTNDMSVVDFTVDMELALEPEITPDDYAEWAFVESRPMPSGEFCETGNMTAEFRNPKRGGVYRFKARYGGSDWTCGTVVLPLSGASVDAILAEDIARTSNFTGKVIARYTRRERSSAVNGHWWFVWNGNGDYLGRADNDASQTVRCYNDIEDAGWFYDGGLGGCATWMGHPIRNAKLSNFLIAYACKTIGVDSEAVQEAKEREGNGDDESAALSWAAGEAVAAGADYAMSVSNMVAAAFLSHEEKASKLWPNLSPAGNHETSPRAETEFDPETRFYSPDFIHLDPTE